MAQTVTCDGCGATKPRRQIEMALSRMGPILIGQEPTADFCDARCLLKWTQLEVALLDRRTGNQEDA